MPNYDVECPNCGTYERFTMVADRDVSCRNCGAEVQLLITSSTKAKGFEPRFDEALGIQVNNIGDRNKFMRENQIDYRDHPSPGDRSARLDRIAEKRRRT